MPLIPFALEDNEDKAVDSILRHEDRSERGDTELTARNSEFRVAVRLENDMEILHKRRSERAQTVDKQHNAPLPDTVGQWANNPDRYDMPGIDTIPEDLEKRRAERFAKEQTERGAISSIEERSVGEVIDRPKKLANGAFDPSNKQVRVREDFSGGDRAFTLAHEAGHASDAFATPTDTATKRGFEIDELFDDDGRKETVRDELTNLSERARGTLDGYNKRYRDSPHEKIADAAALATLEPRAARREGGEAVSFLEEQDIL
ncbi:MAG: hypothetical protein ABEI52_03685 [Halobacteriaceae archaeon]